MEEWARHIWAIECAEHGDQIITDGMAVKDVIQWISDHGRECYFISHLDPDTDIVPTESRDVVG